MGKIDGVHDEYLFAVCCLAREFSHQDIAKALGVKEDSVRRYVAEAKRRGIYKEAQEKSIIAQQLIERFTKEDLHTLLRSGCQNRTIQAFRYHLGMGDTLRFAVMSDPHIGSKYFELPVFEAAVEKCLAEGISTVLVPGDLTEGMSGRPGHVYELDYIGYDAQKERAIELLKPTGLQWKISDGNHDRWYIKSVGAKIVKDVADACDNVEFLGHDMANVYLDDVLIRLAHGEDGSSYAISYRIQKFIEAMIQRGDPPDVAIFGHAHKEGKFSYMGVEGLSPGALQSTTPWMESKRNYSVLGFAICEIGHQGKLIEEFVYRFFPADKLLRRAA